MMVRVRIELRLKLGLRLHLSGLIGRVEVGLSASQPVDPGVHGVQAAEHVVADDADDHREEPEHQGDSAGELEDDGQDPGDLRERHAQLGERGLRPGEPAHEMATAELLLQRGVPLVEASAYLDLTPAIVRYRVAGFKGGVGGMAYPMNHVIGKVSRPVRVS